MTQAVDFKPCLFHQHNIGKSFDTLLSVFLVPQFKRWARNITVLPSEKTMKRSKLLRHSFSLFAISILGTSVATELSSFPSNLSGRWNDPNSSASQSVSLSIDSASGTGKLTVWSSNPACTINGAPAAVTKDGNKITVVVSKEYSNPCRDNVSMVLNKKDGADEYEGEIRQNVPGYPILKVKLSP